MSGLVDEKYIIERRKFLLNEHIAHLTREYDELCEKSKDINRERGKKRFNPRRFRFERWFYGAKSCR